MEIEIINQYGDIPFNYQKIVCDIKDIILKDYKEKDINKNVTLILINLTEIHQMNLSYRHLDYPTDVLSFEENEEDYLGEIFICIDKVFEQAKSFEHSNEREFAFLVCHGILHLLGYDHMTKEDEQIMFQEQKNILNQTTYKR